MDDARREYEVDWCDIMSHGQTDCTPLLTNAVVLSSLIPIVLVMSYLPYSKLFREG